MVALIMVESIPQALLPVETMAAVLVAVLAEAQVAALAEAQVAALAEAQVVALAEVVAAEAQLAISNWTSELRYMWVPVHPQPVTSPLPNTLLEYALPRCSETLRSHSLDEEAIEWVTTCTSMRKRVNHITRTFGGRWPRADC
jgi:hypothetical protein